MPDGRVLFTVADVCGKGLQAALVTSSLHTMVRASVDIQPTLTALVERVNRHLCSFLPSHSFVTMVAVAVDPATGEIECVNCGHPPVLVVDRDGDLRMLQSAINPALGMMPTTLESERGVLEFGDVLAMYTDGLTELRNPAKEMLGEEQLGERFSRICAARPGEGSADIAEALRRMLDEFGGDQLPEDDRAFLLAQRGGSGRRGGGSAPKPRRGAPSSRRLRGRRSVLRRSLGVWAACGPIVTTVPPAAARRGWPGDGRGRRTVRSR